MFLTMSDIFPNGASEEDLARIYRPRPGLPFTLMRLGNEARLVWTTFTSAQVDLDIRQTLTWSYLTSVIDQLTASGVSIIRLDAVGYAGKVAGTNCFMTDDTMDFVSRLRDYCHKRGALVLLEVHGHFGQQIEIAQHTDLVYDFALPPLALHAILACDPGPLAHWLEVRPRNAVTVLDTHDGIGIIDAGPNDLRPSDPGLLNETQIARLVESIHANGGEASRRATGAAVSNLDLYQVNCTFFDALGRDDHRYLLARAIQLFIPGLPQVYYVGLMAGVNDLNLFQETRVGRDVNRHRYSCSEIEHELSRPVVRAQVGLLRLRREHPAFAVASAMTFRVPAFYYDGATAPTRSCWMPTYREAHSSFAVLLMAVVGHSAITSCCRGQGRMFANDIRHAAEVRCLRTGPGRRVLSQP